MSRTKELLEENWYEHQERMELHWMEQEFKNYKSKKQNEYKANVTEESSYKESQRPYILFTRKESFDARGDRGYGRNRT